MLDWIFRRMRDASISVTEAVEGAKDVTVNMWRTIWRTFQMIRAGWSYFGPALWWFADSTAGLALDVYRITRGLVTQIIPAAIDHAITLLRRWAADRINDARQLARGLFRALRDWAGDQIARLLSGLALLRDFARHWIDYLRDRATRIWDKVADLVLHPERLVTWLLPHIVRPLVRYLLSVGPAIGRWLLGQLVAATLRTASVLESIIVRIL